MEKIKYVIIHTNGLEQTAHVEYYHGKSRYYAKNFPVTVSSFICTAKHCISGYNRYVDYYFNNPEVLPNCVSKFFKG